MFASPERETDRWDSITLLDGTFFSPSMTTGPDGKQQQKRGEEDSDGVDRLFLQRGRSSSSDAFKDSEWGLDLLRNEKEGLRKRPEWRKGATCLGMYVTWVTGFNLDLPSAERVDPWV